MLRNPFILSRWPVEPGGKSNSIRLLCISTFSPAREMRADRSPSTHYGQKSPPRPEQTKKADRRQQRRSKLPREFLFCFYRSGLGSFSQVFLRRRSSRYPGSWVLFARVVQKRAPPSELDVRAVSTLRSAAVSLLVYIVQKTGCTHLSETSVLFVRRSCRIGHVQKSAATFLTFKVP